MVVAVLGAGVLHALWNAIAKGLGDVRDSFALLNLGVVAVCGVLLPFVGFPKDRKSTRLNSSHIPLSRMPSSA